MKAVLLTSSIIAVLVAISAVALFVWLSIGWSLGNAFGAVLRSQPPSWASWMLLKSELRVLSLRAVSL